MNFDCSGHETLRLDPRLFNLRLFFRKFPVIPEAMLDFLAIFIIQNSFPMLDTIFIHSNERNFSIVVIEGAAWVIDQSIAEIPIEV
jgi:hypothetical protein